MPLLVPDVPVVTWWHGEPPAEIATDFLGVVADRRITDAAQAADPIAALRQRAQDYAPGDTDLAWTRITPWRTLVAGAFDTTEARVTEATVVAPADGPDGGADARLAGRPARHRRRRWEHDRPVPADARGAAALRQRRRADADPGRQHRPCSGAPARTTGRCRWSAGRSATSWPRSCAGSTPTRCTPRRWARRPGLRPGAAPGAAGARLEGSGDRPARRGRGHRARRHRAPPTESSGRRTGRDRGAPTASGSSSRARAVGTKAQP